MRKMMSFLTGAALGGLVGAVFALLFAPTAGKDLQAQIRHQVEEIEIEIKGAAETKRAEMEAQLAELRKPRQ